MSYRTFGYIPRVFTALEIDNDLITLKTSDSTIPAHATFYVELSHVTDF